MCHCHHHHQLVLAMVLLYILKFPTEWIILYANLLFLCYNERLSRIVSRCFTLSLIPLIIPVATKFSSLILLIIWPKYSFFFFFYFIFFLFVPHWDIGSHPTHAKPWNQLIPLETASMFSSYNFISVFKPLLPVLLGLPMLILPCGFC